MDPLAEQRIDIERPVEVAFAYLTNMERFGEWFPQVIAIESSNELAHGEVGKEYLETVAVPLRGQRKIRLSVREALANKRFVTEGKFPPLLPRMEVEFAERTAGACSVTWRMYSRNRGALARLTLLPLARSVLRKRAQLGARRLKANLENQPT